MQAVHIKWRDAYDLPESSGWLEEIEEPVECLIDSYGFVVFENDAFVVVAHSVHDTGMFQGAFGIPKSCIIERKNL